MENYAVPNNAAVVAAAKKEKDLNEDVDICSNPAYGKGEENYYFSIPPNSEIPDDDNIYEVPH